MVFRGPLADGPPVAGNWPQAVILESNPFIWKVLGRESFKIKGIGFKNLVWAGFSEARWLTARLWQGTGPRR